MKEDNLQGRFVAIEAASTSPTRHWAYALPGAMESKSGTGPGSFMGCLLTKVVRKIF